MCASARSFDRDGNKSFACVRVVNTNLTHADVITKRERKKERLSRVPLVNQVRWDTDVSLYMLADVDRKC